MGAKLLHRIKNRRSLYLTVKAPGNIGKGAKLPD